MCMVGSSRTRPHIRCFLKPAMMPSSNIRQRCKSLTTMQPMIEWLPRAGRTSSKDSAQQISGSSMLAGRQGSCSCLPGEPDAARVGVVQQQSLGPVPRVVRVVALRGHVAGRAHEEERRDVDQRVPGAVDAVPERQALLGHLLARRVRHPQICGLRSRQSVRSQPHDVSVRISLMIKWATLGSTQLQHPQKGV